jgi:hypothetical protein
LSLRQPYAELVIDGRKTIETRRWNTNFRGKFLIHASKAIDKESSILLDIDCSKLTMGALIGVAFLYGVKKYTNMKNMLAVFSIIIILTFTLVFAYNNSIFSTLNIVSVTASAQPIQKKFTAKLTGSQEVPPKKTGTTGNADFLLSSDSKVLNYKLVAVNISKVTVAHIHEGKPGVNGPVLVTLVRFGTPTFPVNGILSQGNITADKLEGPLTGKQIADLAKQITSGNIYVNIHTLQNPDGQIRGQISVSSPPNAIEHYLNATLR